MLLRGITYLALLASAGCVSSDYDNAPYNRQAPQTATEIEFAKAILADLQPKSFAAKREYCGYIGLDSSGNFAASPAVKGKKSSCQVKDDLDFSQLLASYHTHGAYHKNFDAELPSSDDLLSDFEEGIDGYISTPGGRLWYINGQKKTARLLCGAQCVPGDPNYDPDQDGEIKPFYTLEDILSFK